MLENKIFNLNLKILVVIILIKLLFTLYLILTKNYYSDYYKSNHLIFKKFELKKKIFDTERFDLSKNDFEFIFYEKSKLIEKLDAFKNKDYFYYYKRLTNKKLEPNTIYTAVLSNNPVLEISTKNIILEKLPNVIIVKIKKLYSTFEINLFQRSTGLNPKKFSLMYDDDNYEYYFVLLNNIDLTFDTNINIISPSLDRKLLLDTQFYYYYYDKFKFQKVRSILSSVYRENKFFTQDYFKLEIPHHISIFFLFLFLSLLAVNLFQYINLRKDFFYIVLFCNLNFILGNLVNHYSYISSDLLALCVWLILFRTKFYNSFFVILTIILAIFLLHFNKLNFYILNFLLCIVSIYYFQKVISFITSYKNKKI